MINLIWAMDRNGLIGNGSDIPWHITEELLYFKMLTKGKNVLMGKTTYDSLKNKYYKDRKLPFGRVFVASRSKDLKLSDATVINDIPSFLSFFPQNELIWVCGGSEIYKLTLPYADYLFMSMVNGEHKGNVFFPISSIKYEECVEELRYDEFVAFILRTFNENKTSLRLVRDLIEYKVRFVNLNNKDTKSDLTCFNFLDGAFDLREVLNPGMKNYKKLIKPTLYTDFKELIKVEGLEHFMDLRKIKSFNSLIKYLKGSQVSKLYVLNKDAFKELKITSVNDPVEPLKCYTEVDDDFDIIINDNGTKRTALIRLDRVAALELERLAFSDYVEASRCYFKFNDVVYGLFKSVKEA